jgi:EAL domain-containing protein (putative c-di-GMP-specific phosphodiesterase class I)
VSERSRTNFDAFRAALDGYDEAVHRRMLLPGSESDARFRTASRQVKSAGRTFMDSVRSAMDEDARARTLNDIGEFNDAGERMVHAADDQRALLADYSDLARAMAVRTREAIDRAWMLFGRVFARDSLVALKAEITELRRRAERLDDARGSDLDAVSDALAAAEEAIRTTLIDDQSGLTKSQGGEWFTRMQDDLVALSDTRTKLQRLDVHRSVMATRFADLGTRLKRPIHLVAPTVVSAESVAQEPEMPALMSAQEADTATTVPDVAIETPPPTPSPQIAPEGGSHIIAWVGGAMVVLVVVLFIAGTARRRRKDRSNDESVMTQSNSTAIAFDRAAARLTHVEHSLAQVEPVEDSEDPWVAGPYDVERIGSALEHARISVSFSEVGRPVPKRAPAKARVAGDADSRDATRDEDLRRRFESEELELVVQPELDSNTFEVESVSARVYWNGGGAETKGEVLEIPDESELIVPIRDWALRSAIAMASRWHHGAWSEVRISVDVCSSQLVDPRFVERTKALLDEGRLPARCLEIDLTDATLRDTLARDAAALRRIRALGVGIALSDFGKGYSSLAMLEQTPLTRIKLDRSLANALEAGPRLPIIARNLVDWARRVGLRVAPAELAVGEELANALREANGCALRHFVHLDRSEEGTTAIDGQHETGAYGSFIVFRDSFALKEVAQGRGAGGVTRAATGVD